jgi:hypothetical protein
MPRRQQAAGGASEGRDEGTFRWLVPKSTRAGVALERAVGGTLMATFAQFPNGSRKASRTLANLVTPLGPWTRS